MASRLIDQNRHGENSSTYVSSRSTASIGLGGSMPRPEVRFVTQIDIRSIRSERNILVAKLNTNN